MTTNNNMNIDFSAITNYVANLETEAKERLERARKAAEEARKDFVENGMVYEIVSSSNGYTAIVSSGIDLERGAIMAPVIDSMKNEVKVKDGVIPASPATATLIAVGRTLKQVSAQGRKNIVFAVQDSVVRRIAGMIGRAKKGLPVELTQKEVEFINAKSRYYDAAFVSVANGLAALIKNAIDAGIKVSAISNADHHSFSLAYQPNNAQAFNGKEVNFTKGRGSVGNTKFRIANFDLNGTHTLVVYKGRLGVEREVTFEKTPAVFIAQNLMTIATYEVNKAREVAVLDEVVEAEDEVIA